MPNNKFKSMTQLTLLAPLIVASGCSPQQETQATVDDNGREKQLKR